ncbi:VOC family protein [Robertmurraya beringensis]|uniref:VOC family protein n=1 Tax=Robertmurraya beringensis TaxID=641660 RepID=A0ABV6KND7_9BACI
MRVHHYGIEVKDMEKSISFYEKVLHFQVEEKVKFMEEDIVFLRLEDIRLELFLGDHVNKVSHTHICFEVPFLQEIILRCKEYHFCMVEGPYELENGWTTAFVTGPSNETIEFLQRS